MKWILFKGLWRDEEAIISFDKYLELNPNNFEWKINRVKLQFFVILQGSNLKKYEKYTLLENINIKIREKSCTFDLDWEWLGVNEKEANKYLEKLNNWNITEMEIQEIEKIITKWNKVTEIILTWDLSKLDDLHEKHSVWYELKTELTRQKHSQQITPHWEDYD